MAKNYVAGVKPVYDPIDGLPPVALWGSGAPDGDAEPFISAKSGTVYRRRVTATHVQLWLKVAENSADDDWVIQEGVITKKVLKSAFTDGGAAVGTYALTDQIPAGVYFNYATVTVNTALDGDTSAVLIIGDGTDTDRYNTGTPSVFAAGEIAMGAPSGTRHHTAAATVTLTVTSATDFTNVAAAGSLTVRLHYGK